MSIVQAGGMAQWIRVLPFGGPGFDAQHPHGGLQLTLNPVSGCSVPSSGLCGTRHAHRAGVCMHVKHSYT